MFVNLFLINIILINAYKFQFEHLITDYIKSFYNNKSDEPIEIANYDRINSDDPNYIYIPIFGTSDIHGHFYPDKFKLEQLNYSQGGLDYMTKYINIIREEFDNKMLYLDGGDLFQGGLESTITNGSIIVDYFNYAKLKGLTLGNHEFDYDKQYMDEKADQANFPFIVSNLYDKANKSRKIYGDKQVITEIYSFKYNVNNEEVEIKIGVIGLTMILTKNQITGGGFDNIEFKDYKSIVEAEAKELKNSKKVNAVVLLSHIGFWCGYSGTGQDVNFTLNMYKKDDKQEPCAQDSNITKLLNDIEDGLLDAVVTGHSHCEVHHWIKDIPIISTVNNGAYANILYLAFDKKNKLKLVPSANRIEGPLPICEKVFNGTHRCDFIENSKLAPFLPIVNYKFHGILIEKDESMNKIHEKYDELYNEYQETICKIIGTNEELKRYDNGSFYLGNIITDIYNKYTGSQISIISYKGIRSNWSPGDLPKYKIYDILPFGNNLCTFLMKGEHVKKAFRILQSGPRRFYVASGVKQLVIRTDDGDYLSSVKLFDGYEEKDLEDEEEYLISANSFLINGGDEFQKILRFYKPKNLRCDYGKEADVVFKFLKEQKTIDVRKYMDDKNPVIRFINKTNKRVIHTKLYK